jgi:putative acetyltransferase
MERQPFNAALVIRPFVEGDIEPALRLWSGVEGLGLTESDNKEAIELFLRRNPGFSAVATLASGEIVGTVLCGHNGRAGFLYHLVVVESHRRRSIGTQLVEFCFAKLADAKIPRCNIFVYTANGLSNQFWAKTGWNDPSTWKVLQKHVDV